MSIAVREERVPTMRTRVHGGGAARAVALRSIEERAQRVAVGRGGARPMVRSTVGIEVSLAPKLVVVPRRRRTARLIAVAFAMIFALMFVAAAFQTQLARRQLTLDKMDRSIRDANEQYTRLRQQRAELRAPERLSTEAAKLGMVAGHDTTFMQMSWPSCSRAPAECSTPTCRAPRAFSTSSCRSRPLLEAHREPPSARAAHHRAGQPEPPSPTAGGISRDGRPSREAALPPPATAGCRCAALHPSALAAGKADRRRSAAAPTSRAEAPSRQQPLSRR
jgi:hypothetical protein